MGRLFALCTRDVDIWNFNNYLSFADHWHMEMARTCKFQRGLEFHFEPRVKLTFPFVRSIASLDFQSQIMNQIQYHFQLTSRRDFIENII